MQKLAFLSEGCDSVVKAVAYLRKLCDLEGTRLSKAQLMFVSHGFYENDVVVKAAEFCAKASDPEEHRYPPKACA